MEEVTLLLANGLFLLFALVILLLSSRKNDENNERINKDLEKIKEQIEDKH